MAGSHVVVVGGSGFVGSAVVQALRCRGLKVCSVDRSPPRVGLQRRLPQALHDQLLFLRGLGRYLSLGRIDVRPPSGELDEVVADVVRTECYAHIFSAARAVVVCSGAPPWTYVTDPAKARAVNGDQCKHVIDLAKAESVPRLVLVSANMPRWCLRGYREGKRIAEVAVSSFVESDSRSMVTAPSSHTFGTGVPKSEAVTDYRIALVLKPGLLTGTRITAAGFPLPLWMLLAPVRIALRLLAPVSAVFESLAPRIFHGALAPPVHVEEVASAAADFILDDLVCLASSPSVRVQDAKELVGYESET